MLTPELVFYFAFLTGVAWAIINIVFAIGVFVDSSRIRDERGRTNMVPGPMWAFATLVGGVFVATAYWFVHHSNLFDRD